MNKPTQPPVSPVKMTAIGKEPLKNANDVVKTALDIKADALLSKNTTPNSPTLEKWAESILSSTKQDNKNSTIDLSCFGLKTPHDVIQFLKSPVGKSTLSNVAKQASIEATIQEEQQFAIREHNARMHRLKALMFLWFIEKDSHAAEKVKEQIRIQQEKLLHKNDPTKSTATSSKTSAARNEELLEAITDYYKAIHALNERYDQVAAKTQGLKHLLAELAEQEEQLNLKHGLYKESLNEFSHIETNKLNEPDILNRINLLTVDINDHAEKISKSISENHKDTLHLMHHHHGLNLKLATFKEILDIHRGEKYYANENGEHVTSFEKAHFILKSEQKIVIQNNKYYLLEPGQDWNLTNQEGKELAHKNYEANVHNLMCIKQQLTYNINVEKNEHNDRVEETKIQVKDSEAELMLMDNQRNLAQSGLANTIEETKTQSNHEMTPRPTPTAGNAATPKPAQTGITHMFREKIIELRNLDKQMTPKDLFAIAELAPEQDRARLNALLKNMPGRNLSDPAPLETQQSFRNYIAGFNIDPTKPPTPSMKAPATRKEEASSYTTPTPCNTRPSPLNKTP